MHTGTFYLFAGLSVISALFVVFFVPEGSGVVLEELMAPPGRKRRSADESTATQLADGGGQPPAETASAMPQEALLQPGETEMEAESRRRAEEQQGETGQETRRRSRTPDDAETKEVEIPVDRSMWE